MINKFFYLIFIALIFSSCGGSISRKEVTGCWTVAYIDTDGIKMKGGAYQMCFEENGILVSQKMDGSEKVNAEWNIEENDSLIVLHYSGGSMPDTAKIIKFEAGEEMQLKMKKGESLITLYLRKAK
jgi:hypothetical protein